MRGRVSVWLPQRLRADVAISPDFAILSQKRCASPFLGPIPSVCLHPQVERPVAAAVAVRIEAEPGRKDPRWLIAFGVGHNRPESLASPHVHAKDDVLA